MVHVIDLDAVEACRGEPGYRRLGHHLAALDGERVGEDGDATGGLDQPDRVEGVEFVLLGVRASTVGEPLGGEGVGDGPDDPELDERGGDVRPADRSVAA